MKWVNKREGYFFHQHYMNEHIQIKDIEYELDSNIDKLFLLYEAAASVKVVNDLWFLNEPGISATLQQKIVLNVSLFCDK